ncbi:MAG: hypothetical protein HY231_19860 [Acidobacteria bacterium]|nr:hypothetical protein [Acidobacteriota bacterium]
MSKINFSRRCKSYARRFVAGFVVAALSSNFALAKSSQHRTTSPVKQRFNRVEPFLEDLSKRAFRYFQEQANAQTGLVLDRARVDGQAHAATHSSYQVASIASTGFGLTALCIAAERHWLNAAQARKRVRLTLRFFADRAEQKEGWFYHWLDAATGARRWHSEISSIDTALLLAGVLTARQYFRADSEIVRLATKIYQRVNFPWMLNQDPLLLSHGWRPESGFIKHRWDSYSELMILYVLAIASPTHPINRASWYAWKRPLITYAGRTYITGGPLFIHLYSHAWIDFRGRKEQQAPFTDFYKNSLDAVYAHRAFCLDLATEFPGYTQNIWGISASDSAKGYVAWGGPPRDAAIDGTVVPYAAGGSLMFAPEIALPALWAMREKYGDKIYGRYGFADAFNPNSGWVDGDVIGIDLGITLLSVENFRSGKVWKWFMANPEISKALQAIQLTKVKPR